MLFIYEDIDKNIPVYLLIFDRDVSDKVTDSKIEDNMRLYLKARYEPPFKSILDAKIGF